MKRILFFAALVAALCTVSCKKENSEIVPGENETIVDFLINTKAEPGTRADSETLVADTEAERTIDRIDLFVFNAATGVLDAYAEGTAKSTDGTYSLTNVKVANTTLDIYAIANAPVSLKGTISNLAGLQAAVSAFTDNGAAHFVMTGSKLAVDVKAIDTPATGGNKAIPGLVLERIVNKVAVAKIVKDFSSPAFQNADVKLLGMYVVNANKSTKYLSDEVPAAADASYFNPSRTFEDNALITKTYANGGLDIPAGADGLALTDAFYFYPNAAAEAASVDLEDYVTKLVLHVAIGDNAYWYPVEILQDADAHNRNLIYQIESITLKRPGNNDDDDPNKYIDEASIDVQMTVKDWVSANLSGSYNGWMN